MKTILHNDIIGRKQFSVKLGSEKRLVKQTGKIDQCKHFLAWPAGTRNASLHLPQRTNSENNRDNAKTISTALKEKNVQPPIKAVSRYYTLFE